MTKIKTRRIAYYAGMALIPAGIGALVGKAKRSTLAGGVAGGLTALAMLGVRWQLARLFTEEPDYEVEDNLGPLEIRRYFPQITAHTRVDVLSYDAALQQGFRRLAKYVFGDNFNGEKLAMTTPIHAAGHEKLEMTSPVITSQSSHGYEMSFVMPSGRALASLPTPNDSAVELGEVPERRVAVLSFRGRYRGAEIEQHERELMDLVKAAGLQATSAPMFAGFDPPTTLPFLRRNEVWVEVAPHS
ncbi:MAG: heme-binding protein [Kofleriaceae bacterium]